MLDEMQRCYVDLGKRVLEERLRAGWTQQDLACQIGMSRTSIANVELGRQRLMLHQIIDLAAVLNVPMGTLLGVELASVDSAKSLRQELASERRQTALLENKLRRICAVVSEQTAD